MKNKKAQVGESVTWIVATIILVVVLLIFIYASVVLSKVKVFRINIQEDLDNSVDWIDSKTEMAYSINDNGKNRIEGWVSQSREDEEDG